HEIEGRLAHPREQRRQLLHEPHASGAVDPLQVELDPEGPLRPRTAIQRPEVVRVELAVVAPARQRALRGRLGGVPIGVVALEPALVEQGVDLPATAAAELRRGLDVDQDRGYRQPAVAARDLGGIRGVPGLRGGRRGKSGRRRRRRRTGRRRWRRARLRRPRTDRLQLRHHGSAPWACSGQVPVASWLSRGSLAAPLSPDRTSAARSPVKASPGTVPREKIVSPPATMSPQAVTVGRWRRKGRKIPWSPSPNPKSSGTVPDQKAIITSAPCQGLAVAAAPSTNA